MPTIRCLFGGSFYDPGLKASPGLWRIRQIKQIYNLCFGPFVLTKFC